MQAARVQQEQKALLEAIRPDAISLVDAWAFTDYELNSALGREDGDVYADLLRMAARSPLNATDEGPAWESVLKPTIKQLRSKL
jgi:acyl-CoA oxidase